MRIERAPGEPARFWIGDVDKSMKIERFKITELSAEQREKMKTIRLNADAAALKALEAQRARIDVQIAKIKERQAKSGDSIVPVPPVPAPSTVP
jgi:hypothetical protein